MFDISPAKDKKGVPIIPVPDYQPGVIRQANLCFLHINVLTYVDSHPVNFECCISPRYGDAEILLQLGK